MTSDPKIWALALLEGIVPALFWLWFWLKENKEKPELEAEREILDFPSSCKNKNENRKGGERNLKSLKGSKLYYFSIGFLFLFLYFSFLFFSF